MSMVQSYKKTFGWLIVFRKKYNTFKTTIDNFNKIKRPL